MEKTIGYLKITLSLNGDKLGVNFESQGLNNYEVLGWLRDYEKNIWLKINQNKIKPSVIEKPKLITVRDYKNLDRSESNTRIKNILHSIAEDDRLLTSITEKEFKKCHFAGAKSWLTFLDAINNQ